MAHGVDSCTGKSNGLDSWVLSEVTSLLFVYVCDNLLFTSGFAGVTIEAGFGFAHSMDRFTESNLNPDSDSANRMRP